MPQSFSAVYVHLVFSTKGRSPFLRNVAMRERLHAELGGISKELECAPLITGGVEDHVHLLGRLGATISLSDWVKELKRASNLWLKDQSPDFAEFEWQAGYAAFSVSASNLDQVVEYIKNQEEHHRRRSFQDELRVLLQRYGMTWDESYVWD